MLTGPAFLVGGGDGKRMDPAVTRDEKTGAVIRHAGFQRAVLAIALDIHNEIVPGIEAPQCTHEFGRRINRCVTHL